VSPDLTILRDLAIALGLGLLVGLQREHARSEIAGIRTFALITVLGALSAQLSAVVGGWLVAAGLVALAALCIAGYRAEQATGAANPGITTEVAVLLMYAVGATVVLGDQIAAVVLTGAVALLLHWKDPLHQFVHRIGASDFAAIMRFVLITLVILPVLPNRGMGPYDALNPFQAWLMVVLIVGIGLGGYVAHKLIGPRAGPLLGGAIGGLVSSTATTASYARRAAAEPQHAPLAALVILIASGVMLGRVLVEISAVAPALLARAAPPFAVVALAAAIGGFLVLRRAQSAGEDGPEFGNPAELWPALGFAALYAGVLVAVAFVRERFGTAGIFSVAVIGGLTDVDAITLSTATLARRGSLAGDIAWRAILVATLANVVFKTGIAFALGPRSLGLRVAAGFAPALVAGLLVLFFWPQGA
jgi:uncharacterized membrane protein (DUF4010 family)